uniref:SWIM-type domain-containing protein n=1 Tax=Panagrolaimus davidi TaxID=227884 RepID=A0A914P0Q3_9BILA
MESESDTDDEVHYPSDDEDNQVDSQKGESGQDGTDSQTAESDQQDKENAPPSKSKPKDESDGSGSEKNLLGLKKKKKKKKSDKKALTESDKKKLPEKITSKTEEGYLLTNRGQLDFDDYDKVIDMCMKNSNLFFGPDPAHLAPGGSLIAYDLDEVKDFHKFENRDRAKRQIRVDGYRFGKSKGTEKVGKQKQVIRAYNNALSKKNPTKETSEFRRLEIYRPNSRIILIHYLGNDSECATESQHGNTKEGSSKTYTRKLPSEVDRSRAVATDATSNAAYQARCENPRSRTEYHRVGVGADLKFYQNRLREARKNLMITGHQLYDIFLMSQYLRYPPKREGDENRFFITEKNFAFEGFVIEMICQPLFDEIEYIINIDPTILIELNYDTTFKLGDFYLSMLTLKHPFFKKSIPIAAMIHTRKTHANHVKFFTNIWERFQSFLIKGQFILITDQEFDFEDVWATAIHVFCNVHLKKNYSKSLKDAKLPKEVVEIRLAEYDELQRQETFAEYDAFLATLVDRYNGDKDSIKLIQGAAEKMRNKSSKAALKGIGWPRTIATSNMAENMNSQLKDQMNYTTVSVDLMISNAYYFFNSFRNKINDWYRGKGTAPLLTEYQHLQKEDEAILCFVPQPNKIAQYILKHGGLGDEATMDRTDDILFTPPIILPNKSNEEILANMALNAVCDGNLKDAGDQEYIVRDDTGRRQLVYLAETQRKKTKQYKWVCSCRATFTCIHIKTVQTKLGLPTTSEGIPNALEDMRRLRPKNIGHSGQKEHHIFFEDKQPSQSQSNKRKSVVLDDDNDEEEENVAKRSKVALPKNDLEFRLKLSKEFFNETTPVFPDELIEYAIDQFNYGKVVDNLIHIPSSIQPLKVLPISRGVFAVTSTNILIFIYREQKSLVKSYVSDAELDEAVIHEIRFISSMVARDENSCSVSLHVTANIGFNGFQQNMLVLTLIPRMIVEQRIPDEWQFNVPENIEMDRDFFEKIYDAGEQNESTTENALLAFAKGTYKSQRSVNDAKEACIKKIVPNTRNIHGSEASRYISKLKNSCFGVQRRYRCSTCNTEHLHPTIYDKLDIT